MADGEDVAVSYIRKESCTIAEDLVLQEAHNLAYLLFLRPRSSAEREMFYVVRRLEPTPPTSIYTGIVDRFFSDDEITSFRPSSATEKRRCSFDLFKKN
jgi:hypothetical protein